MVYMRRDKLKDWLAKRKRMKKIQKDVSEENLKQYRIKHRPQKSANFKKKYQADPEFRKRTINYQLKYYEKNKEEINKKKREQYWRNKNEVQNME